jgi:hypothetical protein
VTKADVAVTTGTASTSENVAGKEVVAIWEGTP